MENKKTHRTSTLFLETFPYQISVSGVIKRLPFLFWLGRSTLCQSSHSQYYIQTQEQHFPHAGDEQTVCKDRQTDSLNPTELSLGTHKSRESSLPTVDYIHVLSTLCFHRKKLLGVTDYIKQVFPIPKLFPDTGPSFEGPVKYSIQNITFVSLHLLNTAIFSG